MKPFIVVLLLASMIGVASQAQVVGATKLHFLNTVVANFSIPEIKTTLDQKTSVLLKPRTWYLVQIPSDSVGFIIDNTPYYLRFEAGKQYYFVIQGSYNSRPVITEKSEREFILTALIEGVKGGPKLHILDKVAN